MKTVITSKGNNLKAHFDTTSGESYSINPVGQEILQQLK